MGKRKTAPTPGTAQAAAPTAGTVAPAPATHRALEPFNVTVDVPVANVHRDPTSTSPITGRVLRGRTVTISRSAKGWGSLANGLGWLNLAYTKNYTEV